jgi:hypothetical protein
MVRPEIAIQPITYEAIKNAARSNGKEVREYLGQLLLVGWQHQSQSLAAVTLQE